MELRSVIVVLCLSISGDSCLISACLLNNQPTFKLTASWYHAKKNYLPTFITLVNQVLARYDVTFPENLEIEKSGARIVSGWEANSAQFPYQISLRMVNGTGSVTGCGGSIIHPEWALTAAHCTANRITVIVRAGLVNLTRPAIIFETTEYYNHPLYNEAIAGIVQPHDIGVVKFGRSLEFNSVIQPIRLQRSSAKDENYNRRRLTAAGWGLLWTNGASPENMNWVYLRGTSNLECWSLYPTIVRDSTICARGYNDTTQSTCQGDSGGTLTVIDADAKITQVGISSFVSGQGCHADMPAGFIRPGHYHDWFTEVTGIDFDWELDHDPDCPVPSVAK